MQHLTTIYVQNFKVHNFLGFRGSTKFSFQNLLTDFSHTNQVWNEKVTGMIAVCRLHIVPRITSCYASVKILITRPDVAPIFLVSPKQNEMKQAKMGATPYDYFITSFHLRDETMYVCGPHNWDCCYWLGQFML